MDANAGANAVHYGSQRFKRVTKSVMASELYALSYGFDQAYVLRHMCKEIFGRLFDINCYVDARNVFNIISKDGPLLEKMLQIDIFLQIVIKGKKGEKGRRRNLLRGSPDERCVVALGGYDGMKEWG